MSSLPKSGWSAGAGWAHTCLMEMGDQHLQWHGSICAAIKTHLPSVQVRGRETMELKHVPQCQSLSPDVFFLKFRLQRSHTDQACKSRRPNSHPHLTPNPIILCLGVQ